MLAIAAENLLSADPLGVGSRLWWDPFTCLLALLHSRPPLFRADATGGSASRATPLPVRIGAERAIMGREAVPEAGVLWSDLVGPAVRQHPGPVANTYKEVSTCRSISHRRCAMPRKATGSIEYQPGNSKTPGHYKARITLSDGKRVWHHFEPSPEGAAHEARFKARAAKLSEDVRGRRIVSRPVKEPAREAESVARYVERWMKERERRGLASCRVDRSRLGKHVLPALGERTIAGVTRDDLRALVELLDAGVRRQDYSWQTAMKAWGLVTKLFADACGAKAAALRVREDNPALGVRGPDRGARKSKQWIYPDEFTCLLACEEVPLRWRELYALQAYLFLRPGELAALDWDAVHLEHGYVGVHQSLDLETGEVKTPKTKAGRKVPIPLALRPLLDRLRERHGGEGRVVQTDDARREAAHGFPPTDSLAATLRKHLKRAGVDRHDLHERTPTTKPVTFYDLRACGITWMALDGVEPLRMMQRAGHSAFSTTLGYVREAEVVGQDVGVPFGPLPGALVGQSPDRSAPDAATPRNRVQLRGVTLASPGGFEPLSAANHQTRSLWRAP